MDWLVQAYFTHFAYACIIVHLFDSVLDSSSICLIAKRAFEAYYNLLFTHCNKQIATGSKLPPASTHIASYKLAGYWSFLLLHVLLD
jgi:hypothetical protein